MKKTKNKEIAFFNLAKQLLNFVGKNNFSRVYNCLARIRFVVIDSKKVDQEAIKNLKEVQGVNWNGSEFQVIVGPAATSIREVIEYIQANGDDIDDFKIRNSKKNQDKKSFAQRFIGVANGIVVPILPLLMAAGFVTAISAILIQTNVITLPNKNQRFITDLDMWSGLVYILSSSSIGLLGVFFCYSTVKFLNGDGIMGILIGLIITSRFFMRDFVDGSLNFDGWKLFDINGYDIGIKAYNNNIIPAIGAGATYVYLDRWIKSWIPGEIDTVFRPLLSLVATFFIIFFLILPVMGVIEDGINIAINWIFNWPIGLGFMVAGFIYLPLIFIGMPWPSIFLLEENYFLYGSQIRFLTVGSVASIALIGTLLAVYLKQLATSNRKASLAAMVPVFMGYTEPAVYGVLASRPKAFLLGNIGSAILGLLVGFFGVTRQEIGGHGILAVIGFGNDWQGILIFLAISFGGIFLNFCLVYFFYHEKITEVSLAKKAIRYYSWYSWFSLKKLNKKAKYFEIKHELKPILINLQANKKLNQDYYEHFYKVKSLEAKLELLKTKKVKGSAKIIHKVDELTQQLEVIKNELDLLTSQLISSNEKAFSEVKQVLNRFETNNDLKNFHVELENKFYNAINNNLIISRILEPKLDVIAKPDFYQTNNKYLLKVLPKV